MFSVKRNKLQSTFRSSWTLQHSVFTISGVNCSYTLSLAWFCEKTGGRAALTSHTILRYSSRYCQWHDGSSQQARAKVAVAYMFFPLHAHACSTGAICSSKGPRWVNLSPIYPYLKKDLVYCKFTSI
jgi:hypothetical protein